MGLTQAEIRVRIARQQLVPRHRGVYFVGAGPGLWESELQAALLAAGPGSAVSHRAAAQLWGFLDGPAPVEVSAMRSRGRLTGVIVHRPRSLADDTVEHKGLQTTTVARTLVDLCSSLTGSHVERLFREAQVQRLVTSTELAEVLQRSYGRRGISKLRYLVRDEARPTRSQLEQRFVKLVVDAGLPAPRTNEHLRIGGRVRELDAHWPEVKLAVELDSWTIHGLREQFESDRERDVDFIVDGWRVARFTWRRLCDDSAGVVRDLRRLIQGVG
ncbi:MAG TPA: hypothetical protein VNT22_03695 [Baekduia sp.]|nr:hypothetical protein [Baekduia sp.]